MHNYTGPTLNRISCSIVGARGYSGLELARILMRHPIADLKYCFATDEFSLSNYFPQASNSHIKCMKDSELAKHLTDVVFLATPAEVSLKLVPMILQAGKKVIDLSGAFRLKKNDYIKWYGFEHTQKISLKDAHYGLTEWSNPSQNESLIANPGCYATAVSLALIPLLKDNLISEENIVIDAKSGTSGGGKKAVENLLFTEVDGECLPYKIGQHQHLPEIIEAVESQSGKTINPHFVTSLLPVRRGIIAGVYAKLNTGIDEINVAQSYERYYGEKKLIEVRSVKKNSALLSLKKVVGTAKTHISFQVIDQKLYVFSCLDNLIKGAAGQAVENFNRLNDSPLHLGLEHLEAAI